jgi:hypothetical protein
VYVWWWCVCVVVCVCVGGVLGMTDEAARNLGDIHVFDVRGRRTCASTRVKCRLTCFRHSHLSLQSGTRHDETRNAQPRLYHRRRVLRPCESDAPSTALYCDLLSRLTRPLAFAVQCMTPEEIVEKVRELGDRFEFTLRKPLRMP